MLVKICGMRLDARWHALYFARQLALEVVVERGANIADRRSTGRSDCLSRRYALPAELNADCLLEWKGASVDIGPRGGQ